MPAKPNSLQTEHGHTSLNHRDGRGKGAASRWIGSHHDDRRSQGCTRGQPGMKVEIALDGKTHQVELAKVGERLRCTIDGTPLEADAVQIAPGIYSILIDGESLEVGVEPDGVGLRLTAGDREWRAEVRDPREWRRNRGSALEAEGRQQVSAPMPGKIVRVLV